MMINNNIQYDFEPWLDNDIQEINYNTDLPINN